MRYNREAEREAKKEALRQAGYSEDLSQAEKKIALKRADEIFQAYLDECADIESQEEEFYRMKEVRYKRIA
jgi:hypothetical protein